ncbi:MAG: FemAB-related protein (PEP-CTERM system-associated) [Alphaproteobacteria bacterium]|jgi:FemAB-related protein (PEP-CTERM system-associated)
MTTSHEFTPSDIADYQRFVDKHEHATAYHNKAWGEAVASAYGFMPKYFGLKCNGEIVAVMPCVLMKTLKGKTNLCSLPYCDLGGVLATNSESANELKQQITQLALDNNWGFEYRGTVSALSDSKQIENDAIAPHNIEIPDGTKVRMLYSLNEDIDAHMASFKPKLRSQIKKAIKNGVLSKVVATPTASDFDTFYQVFAANMRDLGSPVHSKKWFESIFGTYGHNAFLVLVYFEERCIGGAVVIHTGNKAVIPWASTLRDYNKLAPNMLMYWEVLSETIRRGLPHFDFGRSGYNEGTFRFKKQWGAIPEVLQWQSLSDGQLREEITSEKSSVRKQVENIWQKLPLGLTTVIGPQIRKFISL